MTPVITVRRMICLAHKLADAGNNEAARRVWLRASRLTLDCGPRAGALWAGGGYGAIVIDGEAMISPVVVR